MKSIKQCIEAINRETWCYNASRDNYDDYNSLLKENLADVAPIVKGYCEAIINAKKMDSQIVKDAVENIIKYTRPDNFMESSMNKTEIKRPPKILNYPKATAEMILVDIKTLIQHCKTSECTSLDPVKEKWEGKWLYFNGDESGQQIIRIDDIHFADTDFDSDQLVFDGVVIELFNENSHSGNGVEVLEVEDKPFEECYYIEYINCDYDDSDEEGDDDWSNPLKLDAALSSRPIDTDMKSCIMSWEDVKKEVTRYLFNEDWGCIGTLAEKN